jgi:TetR/AcrR family transcriptional regulator, tetracycline repressor protein
VKPTQGGNVKRNRGRPSGNTSELKRRQILDAALEIVDREGIDSLSMRRLGKALDVDPMAIYHHMTNKQAIISGLIQRVFGEIEAALVTPESATWQARVRVWALTYWEVSRRHHQLVIHLVRNADAAEEHVMRVNEVLYAALLSSAMSPKDVIRAADMIVDYIHGVLLSEYTASSTPPNWRETFTNRVSLSAPDELRSIRTVFESLSPEEMALDVEFGLDVIIKGLEHLVHAK